MPSNVTSMRALLENPLYRAYAKKSPPLPDKHNTSHPWQLWVETPDHRWMTQTYPTYASAWRVGVGRYREGCDFTVTSRRMFYAPPGEWYKVRVRTTPTVKHPEPFRIETRWRQTFTWPEYDLHWCGRCRRPVYWMPLHVGHHALRRMPAVTDEDNTRCLICGIRWIAQPDVNAMIRVEARP